LKPNPRQLETQPFNNLKTDGIQLKPDGIQLKTDGIQLKTDVLIYSLKILSL